MDPESGEVLHWYVRQFASTQFPSEKAGAKVQRFLTTFSAKDGVNKRLLQTMAFAGVPADFCGLRALVWKVLLGYLSCTPAEWPRALASRRETYAQFRSQYVSEVQLLAKDQSDHPLSLAPDSKWQSYAWDLRIRREIHNDVRRTRPELQKQAAQANEVLSRILFIYAKQHPELNYVQGMNELLAPIYYLFSEDRSPDFMAHVECDAYFCFESLMAEVQANFNREMDGGNGGIRQQLDHLNSLLQTHDRQLWSHLERLSLKPQYYGMRWTMLLLTQDFPLPAVYRLWDSILADPMRFQYFYYVCLAILVTLREELLTCDFAQAIALLQKPKINDIPALLRLANSLIMRDSSRN